MHISHEHHSPFMSGSNLSSMPSIQGQLLEVTVVGCSNLRDTEWISRQDPYVCLEYANYKFRTRTCTDGHKNPTFQEKFSVPLIEGLRDLNVLVWNSNTLTADDLIGSGRVQLQKVLSEGYDDNAWALQTKNGKYAGNIKLIMHFAAAKKFQPTPLPSAPSYAHSSYHGHPTASLFPPSHPIAQPPLPYQPAYPSFAQPPQQYPSPPASYPDSAYQTSQHSYPAYQTSPYPHLAYPPAPHPSAYHPPGPYQGIYPPPPY